jgi:hypothetical protein
MVIVRVYTYLSLVDTLKTLEDLENTLRNLLLVQAGG